MKLLDLFTPWAIIPEHLQQIRDVYATHLRGEKIDWKAIEARVSGGDIPSKNLYYVEDGTAIIPVTGPLTKGGGGIFSFLFRGTSYGNIGQALAFALDDPQVFSIILAIDSPGGTVNGLQETADAIFNARGTKPIVAYTDGTMASAAYWIGSAADTVYISGDTNMVGSIGVAMMHVDYSEQDKRYGMKVTDIYAGKYKRITSDSKPLSPEGLQYLQDKVDYLYSVFVDAVARNRGADAETVLANMADGRIFLGRQAHDAGLVDGVSTMADIIKGLSPTPMDRLRASIQAGISKIQG